MVSRLFGDFVFLTLLDFQPFFNALENQKRIELYEFILQNFFVSKNELANQFSLNRANLNHHLAILANAGLIHELELMLDARRQVFLIPLVRIQTENLILEDQTFQLLKNQMELWVKRNITVDSWKLVRNELDNLNINEIVNIIENRLFPSLGKRISKNIEYCYICRSNNVKTLCFNWINFLCSNHSRKITLKNNKEVNFCLNCVEKFFG